MSNTLEPINEDKLLEIRGSNNPEVQQHITHINQYLSDTSRPSGSEISDKDFYSYTNNHNVCGPQNMVLGGNLVWRNKNIDSKNSTTGWGCMKCPENLPANQAEYEQYNKDYSESTPLPALDDMIAMCSTDIMTWFPKQVEQDLMQSEDATLTGESQTWTSVKSVLETGNGSNNHIEIAARWWSQKLSNKELTDAKKLTGYTGTIEEMKQDIINYTNPTPPCPTYGKDSSNPLGNKLSSIPTDEYSPPSCSDGSSGFITDIITDQFVPWSIHYEQLKSRKSTNLSDEFDFSVFNQQLGPPNQQFEDCLNNIFTDNSEYDELQINQLKQSTWRSYTDENYAFIRRKLQMFLDHSNDERIMECMGKFLYLDDDICRVGLTQHMIKIAEIIFFIIGYDPNFVISNERDRIQLEQLIIRLGNYVPRVLDRIIEISDKYEIQYCRGTTSHATHVLRKAYDTMFQVKHPVINFTNPFSSLMSEDDTNPSEFNRATILSVLGIAFLKYF